MSIYNPQATIPGQGPKLILGSRKQHVRVDTSALSELTKPAKELGGPIMPGEGPFRSAEEVTKGLGLDYNAERDLTRAIREWVQMDNVVRFRQSMMKGLRSFAPTNFALRQEVNRRVLQLYKATLGSRMNRTVGREGEPLEVVQKSGHKYLSKKPDGKGGWIYEYPADKRKPKEAKFKLSASVHSVIETDVLELAKDPGGHGLDEQEAADYKLLVDSVRGKQLHVTKETSERVSSLLTDLSNTYDDLAEQKRADPQERKFARVAVRALGNLITKVRELQKSQTIITDQQLQELRPRLVLKPAVNPPELLWCFQDQLGELHLEGLPELDSLTKGAQHKYLKRLPTGKSRPKWRYIYKTPKTKGLTTSEDIQAGAKFKVSHRGQVGHFEVLEHLGDKGIVKVKHDESGQVAYIKERDFHRMITSHHAQATAAKVMEQRAKEGKPTVGKLPRATMADLGKGGYDSIDGFAQTPQDLELQAAGMKAPGREFAIIKQANGWVLASKPAHVKKQEELKGDRTKIFLRDKTGKGIASQKGEYVLMEAKDVIASHNPESFEKRSEYPEGVQERRYHEIKPEQEKIDRIARSLEPALVVNTNPDVVNGTPAVTEDGIVLGGNGRAMGMQRAYATYPDSAKKLKEYLAQHARAFGMSPAQVESMEQPILVRRMKAGKDPEKLKMLGRRMNEALTQGLDPRSAEVALSQFVSEDMVDTLIHSIKADESLNTFLSRGGSREFVQAVKRAGIIDELNEAEFIDPEQKLLNEDGRMRVERCLAARMLPDATVLDKMPQSLRTNLAKAVPYLLQAEKVSKSWDLRESLMAAVKADIDMQERDRPRTEAGRRSSLSQIVSALVDPKNPWLTVQKDETAQALLAAIQEHGDKPKKFPLSFKQFALEADRQAFDHGQNVSMFSRESKTPAQILREQFELTKEARERAKAKRAAKKQAPSEPAPLFASVLEPASLVKADSSYVKPEHRGRYLAHAVLWELDNLMRGAAAGGTGLDGHGMLRQLKEFIRESVKADPEFAKAWGSAQMGDTVLKGLLKAKAQAYRMPISKGLAKAMLQENLEQLRR